MIKRNYLASSCLLALNTFAPAAFAQTSSDVTAAKTPSTASGAEAPATAADDVVVVGNKLGIARLQDTPATVNVVSGDQLANLNIQNSASLQTSVAGLVFDLGTGSPKISLRGISQDQLLLSAETGVAFYQDGVYIGRVQGLVSPYNDLDRVEVFKGPQGSSFGRNAVGGAVLYTSTKPQAGFSGSVSAGYGALDWRKVTAVLNDGTDEVAGRVAFTYSKDDGYVYNETLKNLGNSTEQLGIRGSLRFRPSDGTDIILRIDYSKLNGSNPTEGLWGTNGLIPSISQLLTGTPVFPYRADLDQRYRTRSEIGSQYKVDTFIPSLEVNVDLGGVTLKSTSAYLRLRHYLAVDTDASAFDYLSLVPHIQNSDQYSEELQLNGKSERLKWVIGAFGFLEKTYDYSQSYSPVFGLSPTGFTPTSFYQIGTQNTRSVAAFGQANYNITDKAHFIAGVRYTNDRKKAVYNSGFGPRNAAVTAFPSVPAVASWGAVTGDIGLQYEFSSNNMIYVRASRGFRAGGLEQNTGKAYNPEKLNAIEAGYKGILPNSLGYLNLSAFYNDYKDLQVQILRGTLPSTENAATAKIAGFDADTRLNVMGGFSIAFNAQYLPSADYRKFVSTNPDTGILVNLAGNRLNRAPKISGTVGVNYESLIGKSVKLAAHAELYHTSSITYSQFGNVRDAVLGPDHSIQAPYNLVNMFLNLSVPSKGYGLNIFARNVFNKFYTTSRTENPVFGSTQVDYGRPREVGAELSIKF